MNGHLRWYDYAVALIPLVLVLMIGALGLAVGPAAAAVNLAVMKTNLHRLTRMSIAFVVSGIAFLMWAGLVVAMR
jgi:hypothetical protein